MDVSHPDRIVFPEDGITKGEVVGYYAAVGERLLRYIAGRALTVERFPKGIDESGFMQKNAPSHFSDDLIDRHEVPKEDGGITTYPVVDSVEAIAHFANLGVITFHVPPVLVSDERHPDWVIWDLDPPQGRVDLVREACVRLRSILESVGIPTLLLASGSKGYHLRAPVEPTVPFDDVEVVTRGIAELAAALHDELLTTAFRKAERGDRVFVDWLRNSPLATSVAPWSLRPRPGAPVAVPLAWDELGSVDPDGVRLGMIEGRLETDPWAGAEPLDLGPAVEAVGSALESAGIELTPFDRFRS